MTFFRHIIPSLLYPLTIVFLLVLAALLSRRRTAMRLLALSLLVLCAAGFNPLPDLLWRALVSRHAAPVAVRPDVAHIVVLSGGSFAADATLPIHARMTPEGMARLLEGIRLHRALPGSRLWVSVSGEIGDDAAWGVLLELAEFFGLDDSALHPLVAARTTKDEAKLTRARLARGSHLYLVTSDYHMPRAMLLFEQAGLSPIAAPVVTERTLQVQGSRARRFSPFPTAQNLHDTRVILRERMGYALARIAGGTESRQ